MSVAKPRTRLIDIALEAKVSPMTVASVLTGAGGKRIRVGADTAERVREIARRLDYRPNMAAQQLSGVSSRLIGLVGHDWFSAMPLRMLAWLNKVADKESFRLIVSQTSGNEQPLRDYLRECDARGVDGVIYLAHGDDSVWEESRELFEQIPCVVVLMGNPGIAHAHCVDSDFAGGVIQAIEHLHQRGRRRIVQVLEDLNLDVNRKRRAGQIQAFESLGMEFNEQSIRVATKDWALDAPAFDGLVEELVHDRGADAILADTDAGALALMNAMRRRGIEPGKDVSIVGWGHEPYSLLSSPTLTTVQFHLDQIASHAVKLVHAHSRNHRDHNPERIMVPADLVIRGSS